MQDRMIIVTSRSQGFPSAIKLASLCEHPFVLISHERSPTFYGHVLELCAKHGFNPRVVQEVPEITTVLALVHAGLGVSMIPASFSNSRFKEYTPIRFQTEPRNGRLPLPGEKGIPIL